MRWMVLGLAGGCGRAAVTEVVLTPDAPDGLALGGELQLTATALYDDGTESDVTADATWSTSDDAVLGVSGGLLEGLALGEATVEASFEAVSASLDVTVADLGPFSVTVSGDWSPQHGGQGLAFFARVVDDTAGDVVACGSLVSEEAVWSLSAADVLEAGHRYHAEAFADVNGDGLVNDPGHLYQSEPSRKVGQDLKLAVEHAGAAPDWTDEPCGAEPALVP